MTGRRLATNIGPPNDDTPVDRGVGLLAKLGPDGLGRETCRLAPEVLTRLDVHPGHQIRVTTSAGVALFSVEVAESQHDSEILVSPRGARRLNAAEGTAVTASRTCANPDISLEAAKTAGDFVESTSGATDSASLLVLAPHGGHIEQWTDDQADELLRRVGADRATSWVCRGWRPGGGAYDSWHISSNRIAPASFPLLLQLSRHRYDWTVAFHGFAEKCVKVGGAVDLSVKHAVRAEIESRIGETVPVRIAEEGQSYSGTSPSNLVNRLSRRGGIQIEQPLETRKIHWRQIAAAVADVISSLL